MRRLKAQNSKQKCKYKRCTYKRTMPKDKPRYCAKHVENYEGIALAPQVAEVTEEKLKKSLMESDRKHFETHYAYHAPRAHAPVSFISLDPQPKPKRSLLQHIKSFIFVDK